MKILYSLFIVGFLLPSISSGVEISRVDQPAFPGFLYKPKHAIGPMPGIFILHGSEGWGDYWGGSDVGENAVAPKLAQLFAAKGYVTFAFTYFDSRQPGYEQFNVPKELAFIDLAQTYKALQWFQGEHVQGNKLILMGYSRGAEQALLLASLIMKPELVSENGRIIPDKIVALSPSYMVHRGISDSLSSVVHGEKNKKMRFDMLPAWRWGPTANVPGSAERTYSRGTFFQLNSFPNPILVTHFEKDPSWGADASLDSLISSLPKNDTLDFWFSAKEHAEGDYQRALSAIRDSKKDRIFLGYPDNSHGVNQRYQTDLISEWLCD